LLSPTLLHGRIKNRDDHKCYYGHDPRPCQKFKLVARVRQPEIIVGQAAQDQSEQQGRSGPAKSDHEASQRPEQKHHNYVTEIIGMGAYGVLLYPMLGCGVVKTLDEILSLR
jgi:hypothetical protein